ncbi:MAG: ribonuclease J, partial [Clostridia bacterium]|nr:ribonuclease J [Clostridia bacterium]
MTGKELERLIELVKEKDRGAVPAKSSPELPAKKAVPVKPGEQRKKEEKRPGSSRYKTGFTKEKTNGKGKTAEKGNGKKPFAGQPGKPMKKTPGVRSADTEKTKAPAKPGINGKARPGKGKKGTLRVISLGGLQEIGKNITVLEYENDIVIIDCGMGFPDEDMPGVDLVIPDFTYLEKNASKIRGILLTHGHEDHIGGVPYLLKVIHAPVYGTPLTIGILSRRLEEFSYDKAPVLKTVAAGDTVALGTAFRAEFIHVNHSIADACAICLSTPLGNVVHSGDFKLDVSPIDGKMMDVVRLGQLGNEGVKLLLCESTNAERPGFTPSERKVGGSLEQIFLQYPKNRLVIATFSSNVHRVQQLTDAAARHHRKVAVLGRSM